MRSISLLKFLHVIVLLGAALAACQTNASNVELDIGNGQPISLSHRALSDSQTIRIDGALDEPAWQDLPAITNFVSVDPDTLEPGTLATRMVMFYTDKGFYLGAEMEQDPDTLLQRLTSRDQGRINRDYVAFTLDTSGDARYGFWFQASLGDSATDGTILPEARYSTSWDGAWQRATKRTEDGWSVEFFIPWSVLSMPKNNGTRTLGIYISRRVAYLNQRWSWPALPFTQSKFFSRFQKLEVENVSPRQQWAAFPYASVTVDDIDGRTGYKAGAELFWRPSTNFQTTATLNPDFGSVESDDVIVNFSANEAFFPEKRLFFLEGQEVFSTTPRSDASRNFNPVSLVNTRRIGGRALAPDIPNDVTVPSAELNQPTELFGAIKSTGQIGQLRFGLLGAFEESIKFDGTGAALDGNAGDINLRQDGRNYGVIRALYEPTRSDDAYLAAGFLSSAVLHPDRDAVVNSVDLHYATPDRAWNIDSQLLTSNIKTSDGTDNVTNRGYGGFADIRWVPRQGMQHNLQLEYFDNRLDINDLGFQRRTDIWGPRYSFNHTNANVRGLQQLRTSGFIGANWNTDNELILAGTNIQQDFLFDNLARFRARLGYNPSRLEDRASFGNGTYRIDTRWEGRFEVFSDNSQRLAGSLRTNFGQEDIGDWSQTYNVGLTWRINDRMTSELNLRYRKRAAWLLHTGDDTFARFRATEWAPRFTLDFFPTARQQFRIAFQWVGIDARERDFFRIPNTPGDLIPRTKASGEASDSFTVSSLNLQVRYRWEIAPLSDLFLVYTRTSALPSAPGSDFDDLFSDAFDQPFAEQLVLKLRYRFGS